MWIGAVPVFNEDKSLAHFFALALQLHRDWRELVLSRVGRCPADLDDAPPRPDSMPSRARPSKVAPRHARQSLSRDWLRVAAGAAARF